MVDLFLNSVSSAKISNSSVNCVKSGSGFFLVDWPDLVRMVPGFFAKIDVRVVERCLVHLVPAPETFADCGVGFTAESGGWESSQEDAVEYRIFDGVLRAESSELFRCRFILSSTGDVTGGTSTLYGYST